MLLYYVDMEAKIKQANGHSKMKKGYCYNKRTKKYNPCVQVDGERINLGSFDTEEEAREVYFEAIEKYLLLPGSC